MHPANTLKPGTWPLRAAAVPAATFVALAAVSRRWAVVASVATAVVAGALLQPGPAAARPGHAEVWGTGLDPVVGLASNLNTTLVAGLRGDGHVMVHSESRPGTDLDAGEPATGSRVTRLAVSGEEVYAVVGAGTAYHLDRAAMAWRAIRTDLVDLLASRDGITVPGNPDRFEPYLYGVDRAGRVWRGDSQSWTVIGDRAVAGSLAERGRRGAATLFELTADHATVLEWSGTAGSWRPIGGPAASITADTGQLALTNEQGRPMVYKGMPGGWIELALPAGGLAPYDPGGRLILGDRSMWYLDGARELFARRRPDTPGGAVVVTPWWHVASMTIAGVAPHESVGDGLDASVLRREGLALSQTWGTIALSTPFFAPADAYEDEDYVMAGAWVSDWTGHLGVYLRSGSLPPGVGVAVNDSGNIVFAGRPTARGTYPFTLRAFDDAGAVRDLSLTVVVQPGVGGRGITVLDPLSPTESLELLNCLRDGSPMRIWQRDATAGGQWTEVTGSPALSRLATGGTCRSAAGGGVTVRPPAGHLVEVVGLDLLAPQCAERTTPLALGCVAARFWVTGANAVPPRLETVTG